MKDFISRKNITLVFIPNNLEDISIERLNNFFKKLPPKIRGKIDEQKLMRMRTGIGEKRAHTLIEIAQYFGVTLERVRQKQEKAMMRIRFWERRLNNGR